MTEEENQIDAIEWKIKHCIYNYKRSSKVNCKKVVLDVRIVLEWRACDKLVIERLINYYPSLDAYVMRWHNIYDNVNWYYYARLK